jgi:hypothetical protein
MFNAINPSHSVSRKEIQLAVTPVNHYQLAGAVPLFQGLLVSFQVSFSPKFK